MSGRLTKYILLSVLLTACHSNKLTSDEKKHAAASHSMKGPGHSFLSCIAVTDLDTCVKHFKRRAKSAYEKNIAANTLYNIDAESACGLHEEAVKARPHELLFVAEYAMELHRKGNYQAAAQYYEKIQEAVPDNLKLRVWLSDCYMNLGQTNRSIQSWLQADHSRHHIEIENAIHEIYGKSDLYARRSFYRNEIKKGNLEYFYDLFYLDLNWEHDWWNTGQIDEHYFNADIALLNEKLDRKSSIYNTIEAYIKIKNPETSQYIGSLTDITERPDEFQNDKISRDYNRTMNEVEKEIMEIIRSSIEPEDSLSRGKTKEEKFNRAAYIKNTLMTHSLVLDGNPLPEKGKIAADFLEVCFINSVVSREEFLKSRGEEVLKRSDELKDAEFLDLYAHLLPSKDQRIMEINKKGWTEYKDERFAWAYLILSLINKKLNEQELDQAIRDFPASSRIFLIKTQKAKLDNKDMTPFFVELIKKEFRAIDSGVGLGSSYRIGHSSYPLKLYFELLRKEQRIKQNK